MKRIAGLIICLIAGIQSHSQSLEDIQKMFGNKDYTGAKTAIVKYLADPKNNTKADGWYYKGYIYNAYSREASVIAADQLDYKSTAFDAFKKYQQLDVNDVRMKLEFWKSYLDLYFGLYDLGAKLFNDKNFELALKAFLKSQEVEDYILSKKYTYPEAKLYHLDTALVLNTAIAANQAKDEVTAVKYYQKLVDASVAADNYLEVYEYMGNYYADKNDGANLAAVLTKARTFYPQTTYWNELEIKMAGKSGDKKALYSKYEEMIDRYPADFTIGYNYAVELYNDLYGRDAKTATDAGRQKLTAVIKKVIPNDKGIDAIMLMSNHIFNMAADYAGQASIIKGAKPEDIKKKKELNATSLRIMDEYIPYAEQAMKWFQDQPTLKSSQKATFRSLLTNMSDVYIAKGDPKKAAEYDKRKNQMN